MIADAGRALGVAVAHVCNLLDPERVVVGGALSAAGELLLGPLRESARRCAISTAGEIAPIVPAELADRAELLGALGLVFFEPERFPAARLLAHAAGGGGPA